jgi:hypothetical protein
MVSTFEGRIIEETLNALGKCDEIWDRERFLEFLTFPSLASRLLASGARPQEIGKSEIGNRGHS